MNSEETIAELRARLELSEKYLNRERARANLAEKKLDEARERANTAEGHLEVVDRLILRAERLLQSFAWARLAKKQTPDKAFSNREPRTNDQEEADKLAKKIHVVVSHREW